MAEIVASVRFGDRRDTESLKAKLWKGYDGRPNGVLEICIENRYSECEGLAEFTLTHDQARALRDLLTEYVEMGEAPQ